MLNMSDQGFDAPLPDPQGRRWYLAADTAQSAPDEILCRANQTPVVGSAYAVDAHSVVVLEARA